MTSYCHLSVMWMFMEIVPICLVERNPDRQLDINTSRVIVSTQAEFNGIERFIIIYIRWSGLSFLNMRRYWALCLFIR